jgi:hypothetical protein
MADTDVWPFRQILSSNENMRSAPASGPSSIQARAMLRVENARLVPVSAFFVHGTLQKLSAGSALELAQSN